jgi:hypothetical protein
MSTPLRKNSNSRPRSSSCSISSSIRSTRRRRSSSASWSPTLPTRWRSCATTSSPRKRSSTTSWSWRSTSPPTTRPRRITIQDFGIGMSRAELVENLGTIAHSGSKAFLKALGEGAAKNSNLIGQFGVGFYSAFMVAKSVKVYSHSWHPGEPGHVWTSDGSGSYEIEESEGERRGAKIVIELKDDCGDFAQDWKVKEILERYSAFVLPDQPQRQTHQHRPGALAAQQERDQGRGVHRVLQVPGPRLRRARACACTSRPTPRFPSTPCSSSRRKTPRSSASPASNRGRPLLPQGPDRRQAEGPAARVAAFPQGRRGQRGPPAEHLARDDAGQGPDREAEQGHHEALLKFLEEEAKNRPDAYHEFYRSSASSSRRAPRSTTPTRTSSRNCSASSPPSPKRARPPRSPTTCRAWGRAEGDLLPRRPESRRARKRSVPRGLQGAQPRGALLLRGRRRIRDEQRARVRRQEAHRRRPRRRQAGGPPQAAGRRPDEAETKTRSPQVAQGNARRTRRRGEGERPPGRISGPCSPSTPTSSCRRTCAA